MPANKYALIRYRIIDRCLANKYKPYPDMQRLQEACEEVLYGSNGEKISVPTIEKDLWAMRNEGDLGYYAPIKYSRSHQGYYYSDPEYSINAIQLKEDDLDAIKFAALTLHQFKDVGVFKQFGFAIDKIFSRLNITNSVEENIIDSYIQFEKAPFIKGSEYLGDILHAIKQKLVITINYQSFSSKEVKNYNLHPYLLKEYRNRWYLVAFHPLRNKILTFGLDRILETPELMNENYVVQQNFDAEAYFKNSIGITYSSNKPEKVVLSFETNQGKYLKTQPLHESQKTIKDDKKEVVIELLVTITPELVMSVLSFGKKVKVIQPKNLKELIKKELIETIKNY